MSATRGRAAVVVAACAATLVAVASPEASPARDGSARVSAASRLAARFPHSVLLRPPPPERHATSAGTFTVSPSAIPAGAPGSRIGVTLRLARSVRSGSFGVRLPSRWLHPKGNTPYVGAVRGRGGAGLRRSARLRAL